MEVFQQPKSRSAVVVTTFSMIDATTTGILGISVFNAVGEPGGYRLLLLAFNPL